MVFYNVGKAVLLDPSFNWGTAMPEAPLEILLDNIFIALMDTTYTINIDTHLDFADIVASEIVATGYVARGDGVFLGSKSVVQDDTNDRAEFQVGADHTYTAIGNGANDTFDQIVVGREPGAGATDANSVLLAHATVTSTTTNGADVDLQFNAEGLLQVTA